MAELDEIALERGTGPQEQRRPAGQYGRTGAGGDGDGANDQGSVGQDFGGRRAAGRKAKPGGAGAVGIAG